MAEERIPVRVRDCACPGTPHAEEGDIIYLLPALPLAGGAAAELDLVESESHPNSGIWLIARWTVTFVRYGAVGWNWLRINEDTGRHEPVPFDVEVLAADYGLARKVAARANELYQESLLGPLLEAAGTTLEAVVSPPNRAARRSQRGPTPASTSRPRASRSKPSKSSSQDDTDGPLLRAIP